MPELKLPVETIIQARGNAVLVNKLYSRLFSDADPSSPVRYPVRIGEIGTILSASPGQKLVAGELDYWYYVSFQDGEEVYEGWVFGADVDLYATLARAQSASIELLRQRGLIADQEDALELARSEAQGLEQVNLEESEDP